jgi:hypothetical protein
MAKIDNGDYMTLYMFIDGQYITAIDIDGMGGETSVGFTVTTSYYTKIKFFDYWIKVGDDAIDEIKNLVGVEFNMDESCYGYDDNWNADYNKPLISIDGLVRVDRKNGSVEDLALLDSTVTLKLNTENAYENMCYIVNMAGKEYVLSNGNPYILYDIPTNIGKEIDISEEQFSKIRSPIYSTL